jgi:hypothetical protein
MPHWLKFVLLGAFLLLLASVPLAMQPDYGALEGVVSNEQGPVAGATIEARNVMTGAVMRVVSDQRGYYRFDRLRAGRYSLWVQAPRHDSVWVARVVVERGESARQDVLLRRIESSASTG